MTQTSGTKAPVQDPDATDWDAYYRAPFKATTVTRRITTERLIRYLRLGPKRDPLSITEIGGANSCFYNAIRERIAPDSYRALDLNDYGLELFNQRFGEDVSAGRASASRFDVLGGVGEDQRASADIVFSVGLIEHFGPEDTARAIDAHFAICREGGLVVMTFPTPTFLYKTIRGAAELTNQWIFHDERPLRAPEVCAAADKHGELIERSIIWPIGLTQGIVAYTKHGAGS